ncbi:formate acetyltransferase [Candidatus Bathyarchaeota archaeon]|nr:formate acetyltransferase [Candidatus Bathyarchaeota archaeon]
MDQPSLTYRRRLDLLRAAKLEHARRKAELLGPRDADEQGNVLPPPGAYDVVEAVSGSGVPEKTILLKGFRPVSNHTSGGFFGAEAVGENFRRLLEAHPTYVDPLSSMAGVYMVSFNSYRDPGWNPDLDYSSLAGEQERYGIDHGIGGLQHFCPDLKIGLDLGWAGLLEKVRRYRGVNPSAHGFYDGLEAIILGMQGWIKRHAADARRMAKDEERPQLKENLKAIADICNRMATDPPKTFREACQWLTFFQAAAKMYNGSGEWGQLDELLRPYYERDTSAGALTDEEAVFHIACLLLSETAYIQLGGPDADGKDLTSPVSYLVLEAVHRLRTPANIGVRVGPNVDPGLFRRGVEILLEDRMGFPKFVGDDQAVDGFTRNGYPVEDARRRVYAGCHWLAIPGREYNMMDLIKIDFAKVFDTALREMMADPSVEPGVGELWRRFEGHLRRAVEVTAEGIDFHLARMHEVFPELYLDLFCYGPVEKGLDASNGGVEYTDIGVDGASLATVADSFAALEQRVEEERRLMWGELMNYIDSDWAGTDGERVRLMMRGIPRFGRGGSRDDMWARCVSETFTSTVTGKPTPGGVRMVPGLFSWAKVVSYGRRLGATPDGRRVGDPLSHGPNPSPGFNEGRGGTPTQMVAAVAAVQPGYGNTAPLQLDLDPMILGDGAVEKVMALIKSHFDLGGNLVNINVLDRETLLDAERDPSRYPDLMVRVTGFSAYFASLSDEMRGYVVDRMISEEEAA